MIASRAKIKYKLCGDFLMKETTLTFDLPEDLLERAKSAHVDVRQTLIEALERKVQEHQPILRNKMPTRAEIEKAIQESAERNASGKYPLREFGYLKGEHWISDDFDDELPNSFWLGEE